MENSLKTSMLVFIFAAILFSCVGKGGTGQDLLNAIDQGDLTRVKKLLRGGVDANSTDAKRRPALLIALSQDKEAIAVELIGHGARTDIKDGMGKPILCLALKSSMFLAATALVEHDAEVNNPCAHLKSDRHEAFAMVLSMEKKHPLLISLSECQAELAKAICQRMFRDKIPKVDFQELLREIGELPNSKECLEAVKIISDNDCGVQQR